MLSVQEFIDKYKGKEVGVPWNKELDGECVSLVQRFTNEVYGVPMKVRGHGKAFEYNLVEEGFAKKTTNPRYGDLVVWGRNVAGGYGHVAVYITKGTVFDQNRTVNGKNNRTARVNNTVSVAPIAYIRMNASLKPDPVKLDDKVDYWRNEGGVFELNTAVNERTQASVEGVFVKTHPRGTKLNYTQWGNSSKYTWFKLKNGNYVAFGERGVEVYGKDFPTNKAPVVKPNPKPVVKPKDEYITVQGYVRLFKVARADDTHPKGVNQKTDVAKRTLKVLARDNGRVKVRFPGFQPEIIWLANSELNKANPKPIVKPQPKPQAKNKPRGEWKAEKGVFIPNTAVFERNEPNTNNGNGAKLVKKDSKFSYDAYLVLGGYVWLRNASTGKVIPWRVHNGEKWGKII